jgi:hypothetical protein
MKNLHTKALVWLLVLTSMNSCSLAFDDINTKGSLTPEVAVPLLETQYRLGDLMKGLGANDYLQIRPDGQYEMRFNGKYSDPQTLNLFSSLSTEVITLPTPGNPFLIAPFPSPAGMKIDSMDLKKGVFQWTMENFNVGDVEVTITFYSLTKNGVPYTRKFMIAKDLGRPITLGDEIAGYRLTSDASGNMKIGYTATMGGLMVRISDFYYQISQLEPQKAYGYFGQIPITFKTQSLGFDFFKNWKQLGELRFADPTLIVTVDNGLGFPISIKSEMADAIKKDGSKTPITGALSNGVNLNFPSFNEIGSSKTTPIVLNKQNSNVVDVYNAAPNSVAFTLNAMTNPDATNKNSGFITDAAGIRFKVDATIPLIASAKNFVYLDTLDINLSDFNEVTGAEFKIITDNSLPVDIGMQAYFTTATYGMIDSLTYSNQALILKAASVFNGQVVSPTSNTSLVNIEPGRFSNIRSAKKVIIKSIVTTAPDGNVPVFLKADQKFFIRIGLKAKTKF